MKTLISAAIATMALAGFAHAGEMEGTVKDVDMEKHMITMEDGTSLMTTEDVKLDGIMSGDTVKVMTDKDNMATMVEKK